MKRRLCLTPEQIAWARARYMAFSRTRGASALARQLGVSPEGLMRHIDPEYRKRRNASAAKYEHYKHVPRPRLNSNEAKYAIARSKVTLAPVKSMDKRILGSPANPNQF